MYGGFCSTEEAHRVVPASASCPVSLGLSDRNTRLYGTYMPVGNVCPERELTPYDMRGNKTRDPATAIKEHHMNLD